MVDPRCLEDEGEAWFDEMDHLWRCAFCDHPIDEDGECPDSRAGRDSGSPSTCGERWEDPFGEMNECGKPLGHGGPHLATWAMRLDAKNGS